MTASVLAELLSQPVGDAEDPAHSPTTDPTVVRLREALALNAAHDDGDDEDDEDDELELLD
ncbi:hypothetical protein ABZ297_11365 [Nonomuraea sp. NPDC005983]|uniref:hypothetical protein n=1 Tax=Nonomuraea sp. NPDC005983 TaxID=3155595 RepID=UPI0033B69025